MNRLTSDQVRALYAVVESVESIAEGPDLFRVARLASVAVALDRCSDLDLDPTLYQSVADDAGITPDQIDRLTDSDVRAFADRIYPALYPETHPTAPLPDCDYWTDDTDGATDRDSLSRGGFA